MSLELLDPHMWSLETLFKNVYKVPVYQRPYSWDKEQIDTLLKDIFEAFKNSKIFILISLIEYFLLGLISNKILRELYTFSL